MRVLVNGEPVETPAGASVLDLLSQLGLGGKTVAVERNKQIVPRANHANCVLTTDDVLEVVTFVGGG